MGRRGAKSVFHGPLAQAADHPAGYALIDLENEEIESLKSNGVINY